MQGMCSEEAAKAAGVSVRTAYKWLRRFRESRRCRPDGPIVAPVRPIAPSLTTWCWRRVLWAVCCSAPDSTACPRWSLPNWFDATNTKRPVTRCIWISRNSAVSGVPDIGSPATARSPPGCWLGVPACRYRRPFTGRLQQHRAQRASIKCLQGIAEGCALLPCSEPLHPRSHR